MSLSRCKEPFAGSLMKYAKRVYSQTCEDGILEGIFKNILPTNKYFVEFGAWDGQYFSNTANLRINQGWKGLLLEGNSEKAKENDFVTHAFVTPDNINEIFHRNNVPKEFDLLSIDVDGNDYWIWKAIDESRFMARVVVIEFNSNFADQYRSCTIKYCPEMDSTDPSIYYYGASLAAMKKLGEAKGYSLIFRVDIHNLFFVRTDLLHKDDINIPIEMFLNKDCIGRTHLYKLGDTPPPHWNGYADTMLTIFWPQDETKEWVEV